jgi:photosystem II stability/assembly factor-like uncharacterized protein
MYLRLRIRFENITIRIAIGMLAVLITCCSLILGAEKEAGFVSVGLGGGGGLFSPAGSPHDINLLLVSCDMGGFYRSTDRGKTWRMLDMRMVCGNTRVVPVFDAKDLKRVYFANGSKILVSDDSGLTWRPTIEVPPWKGKVREIAVDPDGDPLVLVGVDTGAFFSTDRGSKWAVCKGVRDKISGIFVDPASPAGARVVLAGTSAGVFRSVDGGKSFSEANEGLPGKDVQCLRGGGDKGRTRVYALVQNKIFKSDDVGKKWTAVEGEGLKGKKLRFLDMARTHPRTVYVTDTGDHWGVYRSDDEGKTFTNVFRGFQDDKEKNVEWGWLAYDCSYGWGGPAIGFSVNAAHPEQALYTNTGEFYQTDNGGKQWRQSFSQYAGDAIGRGKSWRSIGLEVTTTWGYTVDPHDPQRHYICYTDIGFARSLDGGQSWIRSVQGSPWGNTFYQLLPDPGQKGVFYAAAAKQHDIPGWFQIEGPRSDGGVLLSTDHCATWKVISKGFPAKTPCVSISVDFKTPPEKRVIYASVFGAGIYKTSDGGQTWEKKSRGLGRENNMHCYSTRLYEDGALYCLVTGRRKALLFDPPGGLWVSRDGAESWTEVTAGQKIWWPTEFAVDPKNPKTILLAAADVPWFQPATGGLWKTSNGGATWSHVMKTEAFSQRYLSHASSGPSGLLSEVMPEAFKQKYLSYVRAFQPMFHPTDSRKIYLATWTHGLLFSEDGGFTFRDLNKVPFLSVNRVTLDLQTDMMYVCTYGGGIWKGKVLPE